jgi:hypothetical protein
MPNSPLIPAVTASDLATLRPHSLMAFVARCGRRAQSWYNLSGYGDRCRNHEQALNATILLAEEVAAGANPDGSDISNLRQTTAAAAEFALSPFEEAYLGSKPALSNQSAAYAIAAVVEVLDQWRLGAGPPLLARAATVVTDLCSAFSHRFGYAFVRYDDPMLGFDGPSIQFADDGRLKSELRRDIDLLRQDSESRATSVEGVISREFFPTRTFFDISTPLVTIVTSLESGLIEVCRNEPSALYRLSPRQFEVLIANLLKAFDFDVELTAQTRDGGRDIIAIRQIGQAVAATKYLVECKRYDQSRPVGVAIVRALHGVTHDERATKGILVTTSSFTKPATAFIERNQWTLEGRDYDGLLNWLALYEEARLRKVSVI